MMNTTVEPGYNLHSTQLSIQLFIITGYTTIFYVTSRDINSALILSTMLYMIYMCI